MPIGKNSLKRVSGGASVKAEAPKEEKKVAVAEKAEEAKAAPKKTAAKKATPKAEVKPPVKKAEPKKAPVKKAESKKAPAKKTEPQKSLEKEPSFSPVKTAEKVVAKKAEEVKAQGDGYVNLGAELPIYLL